MRPVVVLDTSVVVKWIRRHEVFAQEALEWRERFLDEEISVMVPDVAAYEMANVLRYKDDMTTEQVKDAVGSLFEMGIELFALTPAVLLRAIEMARGYAITVYDAVFLATAEALDADMVTADERLIWRLADLTWVHFLGRP